MATLWSCDREIQEIARKVPDPLSRKVGSGNETNLKYTVHCACPEKTVGFCVGFITLL